MGEKIDLRIIKTKKNIYSTFERLMMEHSFEEIKVSDICNIAMINRSTFYAHYEDKYELLAEYIDNMKNLISKELEKNNSISNSKEYYIEMIRLLLNYIDDKKEVFSQVMINNKNSITMDILYEVVSKDIVKQIKEKNENKIIKVPEEIVSRFYLGAVLSICTDWIGSKKYSKEDLIRYFELLIPNDL